jgi:hypothetical protein
MDFEITVGSINSEKIVAPVRVGWLREFERNHTKK